MITRSCTLAASVIAVGLLSTTVSHATSIDDPVKLSGCLVRGEGDGGGYLLINAPSVPSSSTSSGSVSPGAVGTSGTFANIFYWLDDDGDLREHIGHRVEIEGEQKADVKDGEIKIDRKDQWSELEIKSDGRTMKARVPNASVVPGPDPDKKIDVLVRKVDVERVRMLGATCS